MINSIIRAGALLKCLAKAGASLKMRELAARLGLDRSTTYRVLLSLEKCGLVEKDPKTGEFSLGVGAFDIGSAYLRKTDLMQVAKPIMTELAGKAQETVNLAILSGAEILYIDKVDSPRSVGVMSKIGQKNPLYCTALGKALLAFQAKEDQSRILQGMQFRARTSRTITKRAQLMAELEKTFRRGYALDQREIEEEVECIAAPIRNHLGAVIAAISISGPQRKIHTPREKHFVENVVEAAAQISAKLGYPAVNPGERTGRKGEPR